MKLRSCVLVALAVVLQSAVSHPLDMQFVDDQNGLMRFRRSPADMMMYNNVPESPAGDEAGIHEQEAATNVEETPAEDDEAKSVRNMPSYNFFPISFGGRGRSGVSPGTVAIANSFSTGKKGVANSMATAYGSPDAKRSRRSPDEPEEAASVADASGTELTNAAGNGQNPKLDDSEEDDDDDDNQWPIPKFNNMNRGSFSFFPISFGGRAKRQSESYDIPAGGVVAIANSFSTGRGGMANSQAIAHGGPMVDDSQLLEPNFLPQ